jgi:transposase
MESHEKAGKPVVFIDESGFAHDMPRHSRYAPVGKRCFGTRDWHAKGRTNVIGALLGCRLLTVGLFTGSINSTVFFAWVTQDLLPENAVVVTDNAFFHKRSDIRQAGHVLDYLPPYLPDLNPIEHKWAQSKAVRIQTNCTVSELFATGNL